MSAKKSDLFSSYQQYLPIILQEDAFIGRFLLSFEKILSGLNETTSETENISSNILGLEEIIDSIYTYFNPQETPEEFLTWLAGWVALSLRDDWQVEVKRGFIQEIVRLYRLRGTKAGLEELLRIYLKNAGFGGDNSESANNVKIFDQFDNFPNYFQVQLTLNDRDPDKYWRQAKIAKAIIDQEKPAQTFYSLKILVPTMQLTKPSLVSYPFKLFALTQNQTLFLEVKITPTQINSSQINQLSKQLVIQLQGNSTAITLDSPQIIVDNQSFSVKYKLNYQQFQENLTGFKIQLSNRTDKTFTGNLAINLYFYVNDREHSHPLLEQQPLNLSPVLKICRLDSAKKVIEGNTIFQQANPPQTRGMRITESIWTPPYQFQTFAAPQIQELQPNLTAIIEKIELEAIVEVTQTNPPITGSLDTILNLITVRLQDAISDFHLFTPETIIENKQIKIKRTLYYQQFMQTIDNLNVTIKNLNEMSIEGKVTVKVSLNINQNLSTYKLLEENFILKSVPIANILRICRKGDRGEIIKTGNNTILGTTSQSLS
jgi:phage tail-like protein